MHIEIHGRGFAITEAISSHTRKRIERALGFAAERIPVVAVRLSDINGAQHGGEDKNCHITLRVRAMALKAVQATHRDLYAAIDLAVAKAKAVVTRTISRLSQRRRRA